MYDLLGGGFARYSVDEAWRIPHFEKMLYDTAQLVPVYLDAWKVTRDAHYARIVRESLGWATREMRLEHGGFAASLDADSEGEEGRFYAWTPDQIREVVGADAERVCRLLNVTARGTFEHGTSVLRLDTPLERLEPEERALLETALPALLEAREARVRPERDDKVITAWNAQMVSAFARAAAAFADPDLAASARRTARFLLDEVTVAGRLMRTYKDERAHIPAYADDYATLAQALLDLYGCDHDPIWLDEALAVTDRMVSLFWDEEGGGLFYTGSDQPALVQRSKHLLGGAEPGANEVAALVFVQLSRLCGRDDLRKRAEQLLRALQVQLRQSPRSMGPSALAGAWAAGGGHEIAIVGEPDDARTRALLEVVRTTHLPFAVVAAVRPGQDTARWPWLEGKHAVDGVPTAYVCEGFTCLLPTHDPGELAEQLEQLARVDAPITPPRGARVRAPALPDDPAAWLGTDVPLTLDRLRGQVVVLDFWTYCCINCLHVLPELAAVEERFADAPVVVLGVHSAKFDAERVRANVERAMRRHGVRHPVVLDPSHALWDQYAVRSWPTVVVLDPTGRVAWQQSGEVDRDELAAVVQGLLDEAAEDDTLAAPLPLDHVAADAGEALRFPGKVRVWPDAQDQELGADPWDPAARLYLADTGHHRILECAIHRGDDGWPHLEVLRGFGSGEAGLVDGDADTARFRGPQGIVRFEDSLYVADTENHALRHVDLETGAVTTLAGTGRRGQGTPPKAKLATPLELDLRSPWDVEVMPLRGSLLVFVAMAGSHQVWVYAGGHLGLFAGSGLEEHMDGPAAGAALAQPSGLALFGRYLLVADSEVSSIRGVDLQSHQVVTVVGRGLFDFGDVDGQGDAVRLQHPLGLTFADDKLYVADTFNHKVKQISLATLETTSLVGGDPSVLCEPGGITRVGDHLIVADTNNHRLRAVHRHSGEIRDLPVHGA